MKKIICFLAAALLLTLASCEVKPPEPSNQNGGNQTTPKSDGETTQGDEPDMVIQLQPPKSGDVIATLETSMGTVKFVLYPQYAPKAVENFTTHAKEGYYNGLTFHRVMNDFMIQGGDPLGTGKGGESIWGVPFEDEFCKELHNYRGALSMANSGSDTNGSQFFIVQTSTVPPSDFINNIKQYSYEQGWGASAINTYLELGGAYWLDFKHTVFGQVYEGIEVVDKIASVETNEAGLPNEPVLIESISIGTYEG